MKIKSQNQKQYSSPYIFILWSIPNIINNIDFALANEHIFSENDVANVLKRFVRQLDEPLLTAQLRDGFLRIANIEQVGLIAFLR